MAGYECFRGASFAETQSLRDSARSGAGRLQSDVTGAEKKYVRILKMVRLIAAALVLISVAHASAQSLGDVARKEEERRKGVKSTGKVYTNDQLKSEPLPAVTPATTPAASAPSAPATSPDPAPADPVPDKGDEKAWRKRITDAREALERSKTFADALQSQLNALATDFVNRDDPVQRNAVAANRDKVTAELDRVKKEIATQTKAISNIQEEARRAGVPAGWVR
jgi:hypothetical protein